MKGKVVIPNQGFKFAAIACEDSDILVLEPLYGDSLSLGDNVNTRGLGYADQGCMRNITTGEEVEVLVQDIVSTMEEARRRCQVR